MTRLLLDGVLLCTGVSAFAQSRPQDTGVACIPASERAGRPYGCFILAANPIGSLGSTVAFWQIETYPTRAAAAQAKSARGVVLEAFDKVWLVTIAEAGWRSPGGTHVAEIGPLPTMAGTSYTAQFMEAVLQPGMKSRVHRHSGLEAWYTLSGETCLETPAGMQMGRAGDSNLMVPAGPPMELTATGKDVRRALVLILHDSSQPHTMPVSDWSPKGLCKA
jgi:quercetin dioxygenase-like cupin family protein